MRNNLLDKAYNEVRRLIHLKLMWIKRTGMYYCRGRPPDELVVKKENIKSNYRTAVVYVDYCGLFVSKKVTIYRKAIKPVNKEINLLVYRLFCFCLFIFIEIKGNYIFYSIRTPPYLHIFENSKNMEDKK